MDAAAKNREKLKAVYPSKSWSDKVKGMSDSQVNAILLRLKQQGKL